MNHRETMEVVKWLEDRGEEFSKEDIMAIMDDVDADEDEEEEYYD